MIPLRYINKALAFGIVSLLLAVMAGCSGRNPDVLNGKHRKIAENFRLQADSLCTTDTSTGCWSVVASAGVAAKSNNLSKHNKEKPIQVPVTGMLKMALHSHKLAQLLESEKLYPQSLAQCLNSTHPMHHRIYVQDFVWAHPGNMPVDWFSPDSAEGILRAVIKNAGGRTKSKKSMHWDDCETFLSGFLTSYTQFTERMHTNGNPYIGQLAHYKGFLAQDFANRRLFWLTAGDSENLTVMLAVMPDGISLMCQYPEDSNSKQHIVSDGNILWSKPVRKFLESILISDTLATSEMAMAELDFYNNLTELPKKIQDVKDSLHGAVNTVYPYALPAKFWLSPSLAAIFQAGNNFTGYRRLTVPKDTMVHIVARGEGLQRTNVPMMDWENDNVQIYFDMDNNKADNFDIYNNDRQFLSIYGINNHLAGNFQSKKGVVQAYGNPAGDRYTLEMRFPWKTLGGFAPGNEKAFGFDIQVNDNDGNGYRGAIAWQSPPDGTHRSTKYYGTVVLNGTKPQTSASYGAIFTSHSPKIDGSEDDVWVNAPSTDFTYSLGESITPDLKASFRAMWDKDYFYLFLTVTDNFKNPAWSINSLRDYGWIENSDGQKVWEMTMANSRSNPGCSIIRDVDTIIWLPAGNYRLGFITDEGNAYPKYYCKGFHSALYGIKIY